jgi:predicted nucleotidyltransferase
MLTEGDIERIAGRIVAGCGPLVVGTFGSYAVGLQKPKSDLDLFVITSGANHGTSRRAAIARHLFGILHPIDLHVFGARQFEDTVNEELSFTWLIARQARIYHWTQGAERLVPSLVPRLQHAS